MTLSAATVDTEAPLPAPDVRASPCVWLLDPFCFTPWYTAELALALQNADIDVHLIANGFTREPGYFNRLGLRPDPGPVHISHLIPRSPAICRRAVRTAEVLLSFQVLQRSMRKTSTVGPAVLHLQQTPMLQHGLRSDLALIDHAKALGIPVVHTVHNLLPHDSGDRLRRIYGALYRRVDHLICHSTDVARDLVELFAISERKISVIPHGPLFARRKPPARSDVVAARKELKLPEEQLIVLWQGVLARYKGLDVLAEAWGLCVRRCREERLPLPLLLIAGSGPAKISSQVRTGVAALGSTVRTDLHYIPSDRLPLYYTAADILVYPYRSITTSGALLSGLSYEKPIVASRLAAFETFLTNEDNASILEPGDPVALADALFVLIQEFSRRDPATGALPPSSAFARLAAGARQNRQRCTSWTEIGQRTADLYRELVRSWPSRGRA